MAITLKQCICDHNLVKAKCIWNLLFQVYNRKGEALFRRKLFKDSKENFQLCEESIDKSDMKSNERERWRSKISKQFSVLNSANGGEENKDLPHRPWSQQAEDASKLEIRDDVTKATKDINIEEIVHHETPFAAAIEGLFTKNCCSLISANFCYLLTYFSRALVLKNFQGKYLVKKPWW